MNTKISDRVTLAAVDMIPATDLIGIVDLSAGAAGSKAITVNNFFTGWGMTTEGALICKSDLPTQKQIIGTGFKTRSANYQAIAGDNIYADSSASAFNLTLPLTPNVGDKVTVYDAKKTFATYNVTIVRNGSLIDGIADNLVCDISGFFVELTYIGGSIGWAIYIN